MRTPTSSARASNGANGEPASSGTRPRGGWRRPARMALWLVALVALAGGLLLVWVQTRPRDVGFVHPPYWFVWRHDAPGTLSPQDAYRLEARVGRASDFSLSAPIATLWVATTSDAALALAQLVPAGQTPDQHNVVVVTLERTGGPGGTWSGAGDDALGVGVCTPVGPGCLHLESSGPTHQIQAFWTWNATTGATGIAVRFSEPLIQPAQGGALLVVTYYVASREPANGAGGAFVVLGTRSQATVDAIADQMASTLP